MLAQQLDLSRLHEFPIVSADCETTGLHWYRDVLFGIAVAGYDPKAGVMASVYFDIRERPQVVPILAQALARSRLIVNHNIKFDHHFLAGEGIDLPLDRIECTSVRAALIDEHELDFGLDALAKKHVGRGKPEGIYERLAAMFGGKATRDTQMKNLHRAPVSLAAEYARSDPELACLLWQWQEDEIAKQNLQQVWALERRLTPVLISIERGGVRVDEDAARKQQARIHKLVAQAQGGLDAMAGKPVNPNSPPQIRELFGAYVKQDEDGDDKWFTSAGTPLVVTESGNPSFDKDALDLLAAMGDKRAIAIQSLRKLTKANQFFTNHIIGHSIDGYVYPNYNQTKNERAGVGPGRLSIDDPALQQIPKRDRDIAELVRSCFLPDVGQDWCCADWEQFEFRWFAHYTEDPKVVGAYRENPDTDYHQIVSEITGIPRNAQKAGGANAKQINLGLVFGMGPGKMAAEMGMDYTVRVGPRGKVWLEPGEKAKAIFSTYHAAIPGVQQLLDKASAIARSRGYVHTIMGRHIRFPHGQFTHKAGGLVFQGSSADCMKLKMIEQYEMSQRLGFRYLLSVHDEHNNSIPKGKDGQHVKQQIKQNLEQFREGDAIVCDIPIRSDVAIGQNWWEGCK